MQRSVLIFCTVALLVSQTASLNKKSSEEESAEKKPVCAKNAEWRECSNICGEKSCENMMTVSACFSLRCGGPACACKEGHVLLDSADKDLGCVRRETCSTLNKLREAQKKIANA